ncbi:hypothetical protein C5167_048282 [Papaver somniferum]|uniref:Response regulatory domain-containing protein n=1 Tax=Papaver somniferum TaxID=3469 RepID=A0A4Y7KKU2_PAPSO|nr:hypothetical protein C5167_048282 [Papaver somniferum]
MLREKKPVMSGDNEREMVTRGIQNGAAFYLTKPLTYSDIEKLWQHKHRFKDRVEKRTEPSTRAPSNVQPQNPQETSQYSFSSFQAESRDGSFQGFNAPSSLFPTNNNQRLLAPTHQPWLARSTSIENEQSINPQNIAAISHCNTTNCCDKFMSELNFNVREYLVDGYTDDGDTI